MKKLTVIAIILSLGILLFSACNTYNSNINNNTSAKKMTDSELKAAVENKLDADSQLKAADLDVDANATANQVTLTGKVMSQELKMKAVNAAKSAQPGVVVNDKIEVKPADVSRGDYTEEMARDARTKAKDTGDSIGDTLDDAWIHTKITAKLFGNANTPGRKINVDVNNNVVTLRGAVDTAQQKAEAERVAKETDGVKKVVNQLKVNKAS